VKETTQRISNATLATVQLTVSGILGVRGVLAPLAAERERGHVPKFQKRTEVKNVWAIMKRLENVLAALLIANGVSGLSGLYAA